jgi:hypothetical protein
VKIVLSQKKMKLFNTITNQLNPSANVSDLVSVLVIVIIILLKPSGATMV